MVALAIGISRLTQGETTGRGSEPRYTADGRLMFPQGYREWTYLSSGLGMSYSPEAGGAPAFTNVFVAPAAYQHYLATGRWPDKTVFVLEVYSAASHGSIVRQGNYQDALLAVEAEVKDESRFQEKWAYFGFGMEKKTASKIPQDACWSCHQQNAAVEHSFVQFYPTLLEVAYDKGTLKPEVHLTPGVARVRQLLLEQGWAQVAPLMDQVHSSDPQAEVLKESSLNNLGYTLLGAGKNRDAVAVFERATEYFPTSPNAYDSLADGYVALGDKAKALECSNKALTLLSKAADLSPSRRAQIEESAKRRITKLKTPGQEQNGETGKKD
jgi:tetratricopeptide (TPR) repeat protein